MYVSKYYMAIKEAKKRKTTTTQVAVRIKLSGSNRSVIALTLRMRDWLAEFLRGAQWPLGDNTRPGFSHSNSFGIRCEKGTDNGRSSIL